MAAALKFPKPVRAPRMRKPLRSRAPLTRGKAISRKSWMRRRAPRRLDRPGYDLARRDWVKGQDCIVAGGAFGRCGGPIDPHHAAKKSASGGRADDTTVPICRCHHDQITGQVGGYGVFQALGRDGRRALQDEWIAETTARFLSAGSRRGT